MSTSLARQLEQLRTSSSKSTKPGTTSLASTGPSILDLKSEQELSYEQLEILAKEAFNKLAGSLTLETRSIQVLEKFKCLVFKDDRTDDSDHDMVDETEITLENLLIILSPYVCQRPVQFLLQYLLNNYKLNETCTELLFFTSLQHYEYTVFGRIVESLPMIRSAEESRPRWVEHFRTACHPATTIGLHRHLACDRGFFSLLCEKFISVARNHVPIFGKEENVSYNGIVSCFVKAMVGAFNLIAAISEQQTHLLMQTIVAALKCDHKEFRAAGSILFSLLVTKVKLNQKAASKLLKVLSKMVEKHGGNVESLGMVAILYRCQSSNESIIDKTKVLELLLRHTSVIKECTSQINQMEEDDKEFARRLFKMLAILSNDLTTDEKPTELKACLLEIIAQILISSSTWSSELLPTSDVAEILIETASSSLAECKVLKKKSKKQDISENQVVVKDEILGKLTLASKCILQYLREKFQDEYCKKYKPDARKSSDILFMDQGNLEDVNWDESAADYAELVKGPTPDEIAAKRILLDNTFIRDISKDYFNFQQKFRTRENKDQLNENANAVKTLFGNTKPSFILRQIPASTLLPLMINCVKIYERKPKTLSKILNFALSEEILNDDKIKKEIQTARVNLDLIYLQQLFVINIDTKDEIVNAIEKYSKFSKFEIFEHMIVTLQVGKDQVSNSKDFTEKILHKLLTLLSPTLVAKLLDDVIEGNKGHQEADIINLVMLISSVLIGKDRATIEKSEAKAQYDIINKMVTLGLLAYQELDFSCIESWSKTETNLFEIKPLSKLIFYARDTKSFPLHTFDIFFTAVRQWIKGNGMAYIKPNERNILRIRVAALAVIYEQKSSKPKESGTTFEQLVEKDLFCNDNEFEIFVAEQLLLSQEKINLTIWDILLPKEKVNGTKMRKQLSFEIKERCAEIVYKRLNNEQDTSARTKHLKELLELKNPTLPLFLASLSTGYNHKKIVKVVFKCFQAIINNPGAAESNSINYYPLVKHLENNKATIIAGYGSEENVGLQSNIRDIMFKFFQNEATAKSITKGLLKIIETLKEPLIFEHLIVFISGVSDKDVLEDISIYGHSLLSDYKKDPISISKALEVLLVHFLPNIMKLHKFETCWDFLSTCLDENRIKIINNGEIKCVAEFTLEVIHLAIPEITCVPQSDEHSLLEKMFSVLIDLSKEKDVESQVLLAARNCIDAIILKMSKYTTLNKWSQSKMFAEKLISLWGDQFFESGATSGRLAKQGGRSTRFTALYGKTYVRSLSSKNEDEQKWKQTLFLLENFLNYTKKLDEAKLLTGDLEGFDQILRPLNVLLKISLDMDELYDNSYTLDILLSAIHVVVDISSKAVKKTNEATNPELIVQCIRTCKTPDTKATALLILAKQASCASSAEYVMHNSIPIFTFMGNHFLKIEAKSSFDVACQAIDIIIPHIQRACLEKEKENTGKQSLLKKTSLSIINTFVDASSDMPPHRFKTFMSQLVRNLSSSAFGTALNTDKDETSPKFTDNYLWVVTLLLLKVESKRRVYTGKGNETESVRLTAEEKHHQLRELYSAFDTSMTFQMESLLKMLSEMKHDVPEIRTLLGIKVESDAMEVDEEVTKISDSTKQFEMVRIKMLMFVSSGLLQSRHFVDKIIDTLEVDVSFQNGQDSEAQILQRQLCSLIEVSIMNMENFSQVATRKQKGNKASKISQQLSICCERVLESALAILPNFSFVKLLYSLLSNNYSIVRKKSLEVFISKLQQVASSKSKEKQSLMQDKSMNGLLIILVTIAQGKVPTCTPEQNNLPLEKETPQNQQLALMCIRSFAKASLLSDNSNYLPDLKEVCKTLSNKSFLKASLDKAGDDSVTAALLLCLTDTFSSIGPHAVSMLPSFVDWLLEIMSGMSQGSNISHKDTISKRTKIDNPVVLSGLILAIQKCMENFGGFLNPYYGRFVTASCRLTSIYHEEGLVSEHETKKPKLRNSDRIQHLHSSMSKGIPTHSLIDIASKCHEELSKESPQCIIALSNIMMDNVSQLDKNGALSVSKPFLDYFLIAFTYRQSFRLVEKHQRESNPSHTAINLVEDKLINAFLALALKLPLDDFKPMFYRLVNMCTVSSNVFNFFICMDLIGTSPISGVLNKTNRNDLLF